MEGITTLFFIVKILLSLPLLLGLSVPAIAHNEFNGGEPVGVYNNAETEEGEEGEGAESVYVPCRSISGDVKC